MRAPPEAEIMTTGRELALRHNSIPGRQPFLRQQKPIDPAHKAKIENAKGKIEIPHKISQLPPMAASSRPVDFLCFFQTGPL
jgi:hypothetical protein